MRCIIIEDQPPAQRILKKYIAEIGSLQLIDTFTNAIAAGEFLKKNNVDLMFLDIHLPMISGIDFLKTLTQKPAIILTTAFPQYAIESYELDVVDYLLKPFSYDRFVKGVSKAFSLENTENKQKEIFIKSGYEHIRIKLNEILFIQSDADYTEVFTTNKKHLSKESLRGWLDRVSELVQVHKSYLVNPTHISKVSGNQIHLSNEDIIPIGRAYKESFVKAYLA